MGVLGEIVGWTFELASPRFKNEYQVEINPRGFVFAKVFRGLPKQYQTFF